MISFEPLEKYLNVNCIATSLVHNFIVSERSLGNSEALEVSSSLVASFNSLGRARVGREMRVRL